MCDYEILGKKYYSLVGVSKKLSISFTKVFKLVQQGKLKTIRLGGNGKHLVEYDVLEDFMAKSIKGFWDKPKGKDDEKVS